MAAMRLVVAFVALTAGRLGHAARAYPDGVSMKHPSYYTYDERDKTEWDAHPDFRTLPSMSSNLRRPYRRYMIRKKLGQGKFSDVYEAVDLRFHRGRSIVCRSRRRRRRRVAGFISDDGETTGDEGDETDQETDTDKSISEDPSETSLVVLKCLKPVSERKIRRECLVLTHCRHLPNLVRLEGIVLPFEDTDEHDDSENDEDAGESFRKSDRKIRLKENIGSITDAATDFATARAGDKQGRESDGRSPALVLGHAGKGAQWLCQNPKSPPGSEKVEKKRHLDEDEIAYFLLHLLVALDGLHEAGIIHRDVKPRNTLINRSTFRSSFNHEQVRPLVLVDLGLADFYHPGKELNCRVASRHYKSPELLIGFKKYDYAIDLWSVGCILAGMIFGREPFFRGATNEDQLGKIVSVLGTSGFLKYCRKCRVKLTSASRAAIGKYCSASSISKRKSWDSFISDECPEPSDAALDLLDKLLIYDHDERWTAKEAMRHPFFDGCRRRVMSEVKERTEFESATGE